MSKENLSRDNYDEIRDELLRGDIGCDDAEKRLEDRGCSRNYAYHLVCRMMDEETL